MFRLDEPQPFVSFLCQNFWPLCLPQRLQGESDGEALKMTYDGMQSLAWQSTVITSRQP